MTTTSAARRHVQRPSALGRPFPALILLLAACSPKSAPTGAPADAAAPTDASAADAAGPADAGLTDAGLADAGEPSAKILSAAIGLDHICVVLADHTVRCWGDNTDGQLGNGQHNLLPLPSDPATPDVDHVVQIAAAELTTCALRDDGEVKCWGPDVVRSAISDPDLVRIAVSGEMVCGHKKDKSVRCTKGGDVGPYEEIVAGAHHVCGRTSDRSVVCWGSNTHGELGPPASGKLGDFLEPREISLLFRAKKIFSGGTSSSTCAQRDLSDNVYCWGEKSGANLGIGQTKDVWEIKGSAEFIPGGDWMIVSGHKREKIRRHHWTFDGFGHDVRAMELGAEQGCMLPFEGVPFCWGIDSIPGARSHDPKNKWSGRADDIPERYRPIPWEEANLPPQFTVGADSRCGITKNGELVCVGKSPGLARVEMDGGHPINVHAVATGFINVPKPVENTAPVDAGSREPAIEILSVALGNAHMCALRGDHTMRCWGSNKYGQLGDGKKDDHLDPSYRAKPNIDHVAQIAVSGWNTCALDDKGKVTCWGALAQTPLNLPKFGLAQITVTDVDLCALGNAGQVQCTGTRRKTGGRFAQLVTGALSACALAPSGDVRCWDGRSAREREQLGLRVDVNSEYGAPIRLPERTTKLFSGSESECTCAKLTGGDLWCWGWCHGGTPNQDKEHPRWKLEGLEDALDIQLGASYGCALRPAGVVTCWGSDRYGMLGDGTLHPYYSSDREEYAYPDMPAASIRGLPPARAIALGIDRVCAITTSGELWCWGGVLGDRGHFDAHPVRVIP